MTVWVPLCPVESVQGFSSQERPACFQPTPGDFQDFPSRAGHSWEHDFEAQRLALLEPLIGVQLEGNA